LESFLLSSAATFPRNVFVKYYPNKSANLALRTFTRRYDLITHLEVKSRSRI
jgi:hypothetical protein